MLLEGGSVLQPRYGFGRWIILKTREQVINPTLVSNYRMGTKPPTKGVEMDIWGVLRRHLTLIAQTIVYISKGCSLQNNPKNPICSIRKDLRRFRGRSESNALYTNRVTRIYPSYPGKGEGLGVSWAPPHTLGKCRNNGISYVLSGFCAGCYIGSVGNFID